MMTPELKQKWIDTLRSGQYKQGRLKLKRETENGTCYCCLGVLADLVNPDAWEPDEYSNRIDYSWNKLFCDFGMDSDLLSYEEQNRLMHMNDFLKFDFNRIADYLEFGRAVI